MVKTRYVLYSTNILSQPLPRTGSTSWSGCSCLSLSILVLGRPALVESSRPPISWQEFINGPYVNHMLSFAYIRNSHTHRGHWSGLLGPIRVHVTADFHPALTMQRSIRICLKPRLQLAEELGSESRPAVTKKRAWTTKPAPSPYQSETQRRPGRFTDFWCSKGPHRLWSIAHHRPETAT